MRRAECLFNVMGFCNDEQILATARRRVFVDIDPGFGQMWRDLGWHDPFLYGPFGSRGYDIDSYTVFTSFLDMDIRRTADGQALFEGLAQARSRSDDLPELVPNLVEAMFTGFPGNSGETVRITVAPERRR